MNDIRVVVGIPTYNVADTIGTTVKSLLDQSRHPDELIFCDKSTDGTREVINSYRNNKQGIEITIIDQQGDGVADAYNETLSHISGNYDIFATLQTNLVVDENWVANHLNIHRQHPDIDMVTACGKKSGNDGEVTVDEPGYYIGRNFSAKEGALERIDGWDTNFLRGEDWDIRIRLAGADTRVYSSEKLQHKWVENDPYSTLRKSTRMPTSVSFIAKYGHEYLRFHPSHVIADTLGFISLMSLFGTGLFLFIMPTLASILAILFSLSLIIYCIGHLLMRGPVDGSILLKPVQKQLLTGVSIVFACIRIKKSNPNWNMSGTNWDNISSYDF